MVNYIEFLKYKSILETEFPVKLLCNDCIVKSAIQIILNLIKLYVQLFVFFVFVSDDFYT